MYGRSVKLLTFSFLVNPLFYERFGMPLKNKRFIPFDARSAHAMPFRCFVRADLLLQRALSVSVPFYTS